MKNPMTIYGRSGRFPTHQTLTLGVAILALSACSLVQPKAAVQENGSDVNLNSSWHARIASPADLAGAVQMNGSASMAPGTKRGTTDIVMKLGNTSPGGLHPWAIHRGQCGADEGVFGAPADYPPLRVGSDGTGMSNATVELDTPTTGNYFASVQASPENRSLVVACGNLAAPTG
jgi:hypothetical protein